MLGNIKDFLTTLPATFDRFQEKPLLDVQGKPLAWQCNALSKGEILGSGTADERPQARRIALAEFIERGLFRRIHENAALHSQFWIAEDDSTSGFAAGFDRESTRFRAFCEGLERWAWVQWIDESILLPKVARPKLSDLADGLLSHFDQVEFRKVALKVEPGWLDVDLFFNVVLGFKDGGVFPGSRVTSASDDNWTHGAIEAWRNLNNYLVLKQDESLKAAMVTGRNKWLYDRNIYFGEHAEEASRQISQHRHQDWPLAKILGLTEYPTGHLSVFLWRSLCIGHKPWQFGPIDRFIY